MALPLFQELSLTAQTAYAELGEQTRAFELEALAGLKGSFHARTIHGRRYVYFGYRDVDGKQRMAYVGPDDDRVKALVERFNKVKAPGRLAPVAQSAQAAALAQWHLTNGLAGRFNEAWQDAMRRGKGWKKRGMEGQRALLTKYPELSSQDLWRM